MSCRSLLGAEKLFHDGIIFKLGSTDLNFYVDSDYGLDTTDRK